MHTTISQRELRNNSGAIMQRVGLGESFTVTRNGAPVADLVPRDTVTSGTRRSTFVRVDAIASGIEPLPRWGTHSSTDELDEAVEGRNVDPWNGR